MVVYIYILCKKYEIGWKSFSQMIFPKFANSGNASSLPNADSYKVAPVFWQLSRKHKK